MEDPMMRDAVNVPLTEDELEVIGEEYEAIVAQRQKAKSAKGQKKHQRLLVVLANIMMRAEYGIGIPK